MRNVIFKYDRFLSQDITENFVASNGKVLVTSGLFTKAGSIIPLLGDFEVITQGTWKLPEEIVFKRRTVIFDGLFLKWQLIDMEDKLKDFNIVKLQSPIRSIGIDQNGQLPDFGIFLGFDEGIFKVDFKEDNIFIEKIWGNVAGPLGYTKLPHDSLILGKPKDTPCVVAPVADGILFVFRDDLKKIDVPYIKNSDLYILNWRTIPGRTDFWIEAIKVK